MTIWICLGLAVALGSGTATLDREAVLQRAREQAPVILAARERQGVAEGRLATARAWRHNPELEFEVGPRTTPGEETWDRSLRLGQRLDLAGRGARIAAAEAQFDVVASNLLDTEVAVLAQGARAYLLALYAADQRALAAEAADIQARLREVATARYEAGETGSLETNLAAVALARARAAFAGAQADEAAALAELALVLQLPAEDPVNVTGELTWPSSPDLAAVQAAAAAQPALAALAARHAEAEAQRRLAGAATWPGVGVFAAYGREEAADILHFGLSFELPVFDRGQGERRAAAAEVRAAAVELEAARRAAVAQATRAWRRERDLRAAADAVAGGATDALARSVNLAAESYRLGEIALDEVLLVQREQLEARRELADLRLAAALAALDVAEIAALPPLAKGVTP